MSRPGLIFILVSALCTVAANLMMRAGVLKAGGLRISHSLPQQMAALALEPLFVVGLVLYAVAAVVWFHVLSLENLSTSYPLLVSVTFLLVTLGATLFFKEHISASKILGIAICLTGIIVIARG